jgi:hypothetical protein
LSKGMNPLADFGGNVEVSRAKILGQNVAVHPPAAFERCLRMTSTPEGVTPLFGSSGGGVVFAQECPFLPCGCPFWDCVPPGGSRPALGGLSGSSGAGSYLRGNALSCPAAARCGALCLPGTSDAPQVPSPSKSSKRVHASP